MNDARKTKAQLLQELSCLRRRVEELEAGGSSRRLREDVTERAWQEERRQILLRIREEIWGMAGRGDMEHLLIVVREGLESWRS